MAQLHEPSASQQNHKRPIASAADRLQAARQGAAGGAVSQEQPSAVAAHAKELLAEMIRWKQGYTPEAIAQEAFGLARAFAVEAAKEKNEQSAETKTE